MAPVGPIGDAAVMTTNLGVGSWGKIFDDPMVAAAMLDRLLHRSVVLNIDGESYRMRSYRARTINWGISLIALGEFRKSAATIRN